MSDENSIPTTDPVTGKKRSARELMALRKAAAEGQPDPAPTTGSASPPTPEATQPEPAPVAGSAPQQATSGDDVTPAETLPPAVPAAPEPPAAPAAPTPPAAPAHAAAPKPPAAPKPAFPPFPDEPPAELTPEQMAEADAFKSRLGDGVLGSGLSGKYLRLNIAAESIVDAAAFAAEQGYNYPCDIVATDIIGSDAIRVAYILTKVPDMRCNLVLQVCVPRSDPRVPTVTGVYKGAEWPEREAYDLVGVVFEGHPDLRRIMLPDDWEGHPLRKDYTFID